MLIKKVGPGSTWNYGVSVPVKCRVCNKPLQSKGSKQSIEICNKCKKKRG